MRKNSVNLYLDDLPKKTKGRAKGCIDWGLCENKEVKFHYEDISGILRIISYDNSSRQITFEYLYKQYTIDIFYFSKGWFVKIIQPFKFQYNIGDNIKNNKRDLTILSRRYEYVNNKGKKIIKKYYRYRCNICGYTDGEMIESSINNGIGCACCAGKVVVKGINDIPTTDSWMIPYFQGGEEEACLYTSGSSSTIHPICPDCGRIKEKPMKICTIHTWHSIGCKCSDNISYPEKIMISILDQLNINYLYQVNKHNFDWCDKYIYDFYLQDYNVIIETHGEQHYSGEHGWSKSKNQKEIDAIKYKIAQPYVSDYICIDCSVSNIDYIKNSIISSKLQTLFNLECIDWKECDKFATKNLVKEICNEFNKDITIPPFIIGKKYHLCKTTITKYLKQGSKFGWCNYNKDKLLKLWSAYSGKNNTKCIDLYKDNLFIITYNSIKECSENSFNDIGVTFNRNHISNVLNRDILYKGYIFKTH